VHVVGKFSTGLCAVIPGHIGETMTEIGVQLTKLLQK